MEEEAVKARFQLLKEEFDLPFDLKPEQCKVISKILQGQKCVAILPTGYGKSMCYILPTLMKKTEKWLSLVVSPLNSLMIDQTEILSKYDIKSLILQKHISEDSVEALKNGSISMVFSSPENLSTKAFRQLLPKLDCSLFVCDEAHCISEWGEDFRPEFRDLEITCSILADKPILALTATANQKIVDDIFKFLTLPTETEVIAVIPNRSNIFIDLVVAKQDVAELKWIADMVSNHGNNSKKVIVYCRSYSQSFEVWSYLLETLMEKAYDGDKSVDNRVVELYTASTEEKTKTRIMKDFKDKEGKIKILVATIAFGMGINIPDIDIIVNWGAPKTVMSFWQEVGRCGRDGRQGWNVNYPYGRSLSAQVTDKDVAHIMREKSECIRSKILRNFIVKGMDMRDLRSMEKKVECEVPCVSECCCELCLCCVNCKYKCQCPIKPCLESFLIK